MSAASRRWVAADGAHLDVRGLKPPEPMVAILSMIDGSAGEAAFTVHLERDPVFLYPELAERGWIATPVAADPGEVRLRLERAR
ncbi:MAG: DUF2249 domain-containing protein [Betaproteobacteria bacterium]|nr:DUF2249 domain-containing protein [Betaproteobacteria bacterium]